MYPQKRGIKIERHRHDNQMFCHLSKKDIVTILSSVILPLMLGTFTIVITIDQRNSARQDRREDQNESKLQRQQEWTLAMKKQESISKTAQEQYRDQILMNYIKEISDLLKENNGSLTSNPLTANLARVKTLDVLRQLDGDREALVLGFLLEAGQLSTSNHFTPLDLTFAKIIDLDFAKLTASKWFNKISFGGAYLENCTFQHFQIISDVNFTYTYFNHVTFGSALALVKVDFPLSHFEFVDFSFSEIWNTNFSSAKLVNVTFSNSFSALIPNELHGVDFSFAQLQKVNFCSSELSFSSCRFHHTKMYQTTFKNFQCQGVIFSYAHMSMTMFSNANLSRSTFVNANLKNVFFDNADLTNVNFHRANLENADLVNTTITDIQLYSALSIRNAKLPNETFGRPRNLIANGDANCKDLFMMPWHIEQRSIIIKASQ